MSNTTDTTATTLVISNVLPQTRFDVCWLEPLNGGQQWSKLMGCSLIIYSWSFSQRKSLWNVILVHAIGGLLGTLLENVWVAAANCHLMTQKPNSTNFEPSSFAYILFVNEVNWIAHESTVIIYSYIKTRIVLKNPTVEKVVNYFLGAMFLAYVGLRVNIGWLRYKNNQLMDEDIALAHNYVYIAWLVADAVLMALLFLNVLDHLRQSRPSAAARARHGHIGHNSSSTSHQSNVVVKSLLNSSLPRFAVIFFNTAIISILNFLLRNPNLDDSLELTLKNFSKFTSMVKGTYPTLLLLDILMTRFLLYAKDTANSSADTANTNNGGGGGGGGGLVTGGGMGGVITAHGLHGANLSRGSFDQGKSSSAMRAGSVSYTGSGSVGSVVSGAGAPLLGGGAGMGQTTATTHTQIQAMIMYPPPPAPPLFSPSVSSATTTSGTLSSSGGGGVGDVAYYGLRSAQILYADPSGGVDAGGDGGDGGGAGGFTYNRYVGGGVTERQQAPPQLYSSGGGGGRPLQHSNSIRKANPQTNF
ncbi:hypothetical protein DFJ73DRAFT_965508 [Zopfochytrium polystomum]|nr:hypothetical protein DFJ73DRAFT_965508 [Zopfochytrium polystomum]